MHLKTLLLAGAAAFALTACGGGSSGSKSDGKAASPKTASPIEAKFTLKDAQPLDVDALFALAPEDARPTYGAAEFDKALGATVITDLKFSDGGDEAITIDRAELYGVDTDAMSRVNAAENAGVDAPFETIFEKVRLYGVHPDGDSDEAEVSIGAVEIDGLRIRQGGYDEDSNDNAAFFFNAFALDGLYFKDVSAGGSEAEGSAAVFAVPDLRFVGVEGGKVGAIIVNDLDYSVTQSEQTVAAMTGLLGEQGALIMNSPLRNFIAPGSQRGAIGSMVWKGLDFSGLLEYGLKGEEPPMTAKNLLQIGKIEYSDMESHVNGRLLYKGEGGSLSATESTWLIPTKLRASSKNDFYDFTAYTSEGEEEVLGIIKKHGLDKVNSTSEMSWDWDPDKGGAVFSTSFKSDKFADFAMGFDVSGFEIKKIAAAIEADDEDLAARLGLFKSFSFSLKDEKLLDTIFDIAALQMGGGTGEDLRQSAPAMIRLSGVQASALNPRFGDYVEAFASFISEGGSIEIKAQPDAPVPLAAIAEAGEAGPQTLPDVIGLEVTHKK